MSYLESIVDAMKNFPRYTGETFRKLYKRYRYYHGECANHPSHDIEDKILLLVEDVSYTKVDKKACTVEGVVDLGTCFQGNYGSTWPYNATPYVCTYKNFYLMGGEYSPSRVVGLEKDGSGNYIKAQDSDPDPEMWVAVRVLPDHREDRPDNHSSWMHIPHEYEDPSQLEDFNIFCEKCGITRVIYPPTTSDKYSSNWTKNVKWE